MRYTVVDLTQQDLVDILTLSRIAEGRLRPDIPAVPHPAGDALGNVVRDRLSLGTGVGLRDHAGELAGFIIPGIAVPGVHGSSAGTWAPPGCVVIPSQSPDWAVAEMLRALACRPDYAGIDALALTTFVNDTVAARTLSQYGFGNRCADAVAFTDHLIRSVDRSDVRFEVVSWEDAGDVLPLAQRLAHHLTQSPIHMEYFEFTTAGWAERGKARNTRYAIARVDSDPIGYIEVTRFGENYLTTAPNMRSICGAYLDPAWRSKKVMRDLLAELAASLKMDGITHLGVDYETFNPEARLFWEKHFSVYTRSWNRRFDRPWGES